MKAPVDELSILLGLDGLALMKHQQSAGVEEDAMVGTAEAILRALLTEHWEKELKLNRLPN